MKKQIKENTKRIERLEMAFMKMTKDLTWHTKIGYYMATLLTAITLKIIVS